MTAAKKKLAVYLPGLSGGGVERMYSHMVPAFAAAGFDVTLLLQKSTKETLLSARILSLGKDHTWQCLLPLARFLEKERPDILLSNLGHNNVVALLAAALAGLHTPVVVCQHNALSAESAMQGWKHRLLPLLYRLLLRRAHGVVAVSNGVADDLAEVCGLPRPRITVIPNPVVFADFDARMMESLAHPWLAQGEQPFLLGVGRLVPQKNFALLIAAFARVLGYRDIRLILLGDGPLKNDLAAQAASLGVADRLSMPGYELNPLPFMRKAAVLVMPSLYEGFGNVLAEALACGTQVVSTDCPYGPSEILEGGKYGKLVPVGDEEAMSAAILATLKNPLPGRLLRERGGMFTVERALKSYVELFGQAEGRQTIRKAA